MHGIQCMVYFARSPSTAWYVCTVHGVFCAAYSYCIVYSHRARPDRNSSQGSPLNCLGPVWAARSQPVRGETRLEPGPVRSPDSARPPRKFLHSKFVNNAHAQSCFPKKTFFISSSSAAYEKRLSFQLISTLDLMNESYLTKHI